MLLTCLNWMIIWMMNVWIHIYIYIYVSMYVYEEKLFFSKTIHVHSLITMLNQIKHLIIYLLVKTSSQQIFFLIFISHSCKHQKWHTSNNDWSICLLHCLQQCLSCCWVRLMMNYQNLSVKDDIHDNKKRISL